MGQILQGKKVENFETLRKAKDGRKIPVSVTVSPIFNKDKVIIGASTTARDPSDRLVADKKSHSGCYRLILGCGYNRYNASGIITSWNKAAKKNIGLYWRRGSGLA